MAVLRYPVLLWKDALGQYTASLVEGSIAAAGTLRAEVLGEIKEALEYHLRQGRDYMKPEAVDWRLEHYKVTVRPEYRAENNRVHAAEAMNLLVPCVHGRDVNGLFYCAVPTMGILFNYGEKEKLKDTVSHYVQQALEKRTPEQMARCLTPREVELDEILLSRPPVKQPEKMPATKTLLEVAESMEGKEFRGGISRPWGRERDVNRLCHLLTTERSSIILVGGAGCGKTAVVTETARTIGWLRREKGEEGEVATPKFWMTSGQRIIAGMRYLGQWEERVDAMIKELDGIRGTLCCENLMGLIKSAGRDPVASIAAYMVPFIQRGELRLVVEATPEELDACRRLLPAIVECCQIIRMAPMEREAAIMSLNRTVEIYAQNRKMTLEAGGVELIHRLFSRFMPYQEFPGSCAEFLLTLFDQAVRDKRKSITTAEILRQFVRRTGLPEWLLRDDYPLAREAVVDIYRKSIVAQDAACEALADVVMTFKAGINDPGRPLAVMLLAGPTGVGKTELAKTVARHLFGHSERDTPLVRLDMSEYGGAGAAERLVSTPAGEPSALVKKLRSHPFCVLLLDEIEKAAPEVFDVLLGVLDEGRLTDAYGRLTQFRSAIILMTSNLGAEKREPFGLARGPAATTESEVLAFFRPEFVNRIDRVVTFGPLTRESMVRIVEKELAELALREGMARRKIKISWTPEVVEKLIESGFDRRYGARPLQRTIERMVTARLARFMLENKPKAGAKAHLAMRDGEVIVE